MRLTKRKTILGLAGASAVLAAGIAVPSLAFAADDPSPNPSTSSAPAKPGDPKADPRAGHQDELAAALATELGIDKDKVSAALDKVLAEQRANHPHPDGRPGAPDGKPGPAEDLKARLAKAVTDGTLTQAEADAITKAADSGVLGPRGGPHGRPGAPAAPDAPDAPTVTD